MKALHKLLWLVAFTFTLQSCSDDDETVTNPSSLFFTIVPQNYRVTTDSIANASLLVVINNIDGEVVFSSDDVPFKFEKDHFTTVPLELPPGTYQIAELMLIRTDGKILCAMPSEDSPLNARFSLLRDREVVIGSSAANSIQWPLVPTACVKPADFGWLGYYLTHSFNVVATVDDGGRQVNVAANAVILDGTDTVQVLRLLPRLNRIFVAGDRNYSYTLAVAERSYAQVKTEFTTRDFNRKYHIKPYRVRMVPAFTLSGSLRGTDNIIRFLIGGPGGTIMVDWGDGTQDVYSIEQYKSVEHQYLTSPYFIAVTGDLGNILIFHSSYGDGPFEDVSFERLRNLKEMGFMLSKGPSVIDLKHNRKLEQALISDCQDLQELILPSRHRIRFLEIDGYNRLDTRDVDSVISNIYSNAVKEDIRNGFISIRKTSDWLDPSLLGPPSPESIQKLLVLKRDYEWMVEPEEAFEE